jgi:3-hydroxyisobutyrate dehydrogenase-like beta-hydroxyacid dehydrogenase
VAAWSRRSLGPNPAPSPQTRNLLKAGYRVVVWNRNAAKCDPLVAEGAQVGGQAGALLAPRCPVAPAAVAEALR